MVTSIISNKLPTLTSTSSCTSSQSVDQFFSNEESGECSYASDLESNIDAHSMSMQNEFNDKEEYLEVIGNLHFFFFLYFSLFVVSLVIISLIYYFINL